MAIFLSIYFPIICILLILVILLQKGRGGGLGAAFGGAGSSAFGTRTGDVFTWVTIVLTSLFLLVSVAAVIHYKPAQKPVSAPIMTPPPGPIANAVQVTIERAQKNAAIHYTTDLSEPTLNSPQYAGDPVTVKPGDTIKAKAFYNGQESPTAVGNYTVISPTSQPAGSAASEPSGKEAATHPDSAATKAAVNAAESKPAL